MKIRASILGFTSGLLSLAFCATAFAAEPLRVCADPDNLPFSKSEGPERGLYIDLAELVAKKINATPVQYTWWLTYFQRRALRNSAGECDAVFALPTNADYRARGLQKTAAFLDMSYALVSAPGFTFNGLDDLKGRKLGVQFQTNPHILLSQRNDLPFTTFKSSDEIFAALGKGEIDAGFLWGPVAGYDNLRLHGGKFKVTSLAGPDLTGQVSVAVSREKTELLKDIDAALVALKPEIASLAARYGLPAGAAVKLTIVSNADLPRPHGAFAGQVPDRWVVKAQAKPDEAAKPKPAAKTSAKAQTTAKSDPGASSGGVTRIVPDAAVGLSPTALLGRVRFNDQCSHCHGSDGASPVRERDVRRLKMRYDAKWRETAVITIKNGRSDAGMPPWKDILKEAEIEQLLAFIETMQK